MVANSRKRVPSDVEDEERLAEALINRGLISREERDRCSLASGSATGPEAFLRRLLASGCLTEAQARRIAQELNDFVEQRIPGYQMLEKIGKGATGTVYKARQLSMNRLVAIKILHRHRAEDPVELERFLREAHLAAKLGHTNIVQGIDAGSAGNTHYFVMEYIEGTTIREMMEGGKAFAEAEAVDITYQIALALDHVHQRGLIHRDIKPANIVITRDGVAKLADLGLATLTEGEDLADLEKGLVHGTPFYIAPERIRGKDDVDIRADIYSLGATLYHMVTTQPPYQGKTVQAIYSAHLRGELTPPDHINTRLSAGLGELVEFMMARDRDDRYPTPKDLLIDVECLRAGEPPKLARQRIGTSALAQLTEGESVDEVNDAPGGGSGGATFWLAILGGLLLVSVLLNLVLLLR